MEKELKEYGLHIEYAKEPEEPIDFEIRDSRGELYATVWGSNPRDDVQIDCKHDFVEYDDEETVGECPICGATCNAHYEADTGNVEDYYWSGRILAPHEWFPRKTPGGIIGDILKEISDGKRRNV